ncbi:toxin-like protein 14 isoform X2 [Dermacentor variabilis]|uniref:toxin-like protein 14 isoform X2 n=1 Tax=Dermacentor variabilis TaxID=34621 RepID=UPI003F5B6AB4
MDLPRVLSMSPHKWDLRSLYLIAFASALLIQRSTAYSVKKSCTTPDGTKSEGQVWYDDARCIKMTCMQGFPVTSSCGKPQPRGKNCREIPGKGRFPECCTKLLCQTDGRRRQTSDHTTFGRWLSARSASSRQHSSSSYHSRLMYVRHEVQCLNMC